MGNTPTCVGKTGTAEHEVPVDEETPPRAWGRRFHSTVGTSQIGNTPTCVGKTFGCSKGKTSFWKHPHVRGEDANRMWFFAGRAETPPRAWGRLHGLILLVLSSGNTPTCVGKTASKSHRRQRRRKHPHVRGEDQRRQSARRFCGQKHPHVRGEDTMDTVYELPVVETPPRAWGRQRSIYGIGSILGNTPTCVGKTPSS